MTSLARTLADLSSLKALWLVAIVIVLALAAWVSSLFFGASAQEVAMRTATPTKTPGVAPAAGTAGMTLLGQGLLPTATPPATAVSQTPTHTPEPVIASGHPVDAPPLWVVELAVRRGLNPNGRYLVVDQNNQQMHVVEDGRLVRLLEITTGDPDNGWDTPAWYGIVGDYWGTFQGRGGVMADEGWWLFERGGNFLIHGLPYTLDRNGEKRYKGEDDLGAAPASSGCIRLSPGNAEWFTNWGPAGVPIIILPYSDPALAEG